MMFKKMMEYSMSKPKAVLAVCFFFVLLAAFQFPKIKVDTDPENMLPEDSLVRVFHAEVKKEFAVYDFIVLGVVNEKQKDGVFTVSALNNIFDITHDIKNIKGVIANELIALSTKDNVEQESLGAVTFNWLMESKITTSQQALDIKNKAQMHPMFRDSVVASDGKAVAIYVPIEKKNLSYEISQKIQKIVKSYKGDEQYYITGLPVAEDQFGVEMFKQMAISAPLAGLVIFILMYVFFKSLALITAPMILAVLTVLMTMGLLIAFGFPVHIMSSMIPIFLMPIAVLDSVHILSDFLHKFRKTQKRKKSILEVYQELFMPMLFTSLTSIAGFYSLSFSEIPPVQIFGIFVAIGIAIAWLLTMTFIPAYIMLLKESTFEKLIQKLSEKEEIPFIENILKFLHRNVSKYFKAILAITILLIGISIYGITRIQVNDNPVRWFEEKHSLRIADKILNKHFSGTYEAYLVLESLDFGEERFIEPQMLGWVELLQDDLMKSGYVGKTTALTDIVKKIYYELLGGNPNDAIIPSTKQAVAQTLISYENSHKPDDLWHLTTPDYGKLNIWLQLKSGDNKDMSQVVRRTDAFIKQNPPPFSLTHRWAGKNYLNVVWQDNMVSGMLINFLGSFFIVLFMMLFLLKSPVKALISMIPLSVTILFIYGLLGFIGKDYDMPVAVLSALTLGLSVDFAIHFIQRAEDIYKENGSWEKTMKEMFKAPGYAIILNAIIVAVGFLPLLAAPLVPYKTVGFFMFSIMVISSMATLFILPAIVFWKPQSIFEKEEKPGCRCGHCMLISFFVAVTVMYILRGYSLAGWTVSSFISIGIIVFLSVLCYSLSKRKICLTEGGKK